MICLKSCILYSMPIIHSELDNWFHAIGSGHMMGIRHFEFVKSRGIRRIHTKDASE
jgi:hypothetical protein